MQNEENQISHEDDLREKNGMGRKGSTLRSTVVAKSTFSFNRSIMLSTFGGSSLKETNADKIKKRIEKITNAEHLEDDNSDDGDAFD